MEDLGKIWSQLVVLDVDVFASHMYYVLDYRRRPFVVRGVFVQEVPELLRDENFRLSLSYCLRNTFFPKKNGNKLTYLHGYFTDSVFIQEIQLFLKSSSDRLVQLLCVLHVRDTVSLEYRSLDETPLLSIRLLISS